MKTRIAVAAAAALTIVVLSAAGQAADLHAIPIGPMLDPRPDANGDGFVGVTDLGLVLSDWGNTPPIDPRADTDGDGTVGPPDLDFVLADWGTGSLVPPTPAPGITFNIVQAHDPSWPAEYVTQDLVIDTTTDWLAAQLIVTLDEAERIYQFDPPFPSPPQLPVPEYDTQLAAGVLGVRAAGALGAVDLGGAIDGVFDENAISVAWFTTHKDEVGGLTLARITLVDDATGTWSFLATAAPGDGPLLLASGPVVDGHMVPEPASALVLACCAAWAAFRQCKPSRNRCKR